MEELEKSVGQRIWRKRDAVSIGGDAVRMDAPAPNREIRFGLSVSTTGTFSAEGPHYVNDVRLVEKHINQAGGINGQKLHVLIFDNQSTNPGAHAALNKAVEQEHVLAHIGGNKSTQILARSDAIKIFGIPTLVGGTNMAITKQGNPWFFRLRVRDDIVGPACIATRWTTVSGPDPSSRPIMAPSTPYRAESLGEDEASDQPILGIGGLHELPSQEAGARWPGQTFRSAALSRKRGVRESA